MFLKSEKITSLDLTLLISNNFGSSFFGIGYALYLSKSYGKNSLIHLFTLT